MNKQSNKEYILRAKERAEYWAGIDAAMHRAAKEARKRAIETTGSVPTWRDGKIVYDTEV